MHIFIPQSPANPLRQLICAVRNRCVPFMISCGLYVPYTQLILKNTLAY